MGAYKNYASTIVRQLWDFAEREFGDRQELFETPERSANRPPVFLANTAEHNLLFPPGSTPDIRQAIISCIPNR